MNHKEEKNQESKGILSEVIDMADYNISIMKDYNLLRDNISDGMAPQEVINQLFCIENKVSNLQEKVKLVLMSIQNEKEKIENSIPKIYFELVENEKEVNENILVTGEEFLEFINYLKVNMLNIDFINGTVIWDSIYSATEENLKINRNGKIRPPVNVIEKNECEIEIYSGSINSNWSDKNIDIKEAFKNFEIKR